MLETGLELSYWNELTQVWVDKAVFREEWLR